MVILKFNKLIRNKWVWGVFAVAVSVFFCLPDDMFSSRGDGSPTQGQCGTLAGNPVMLKDFAAIADDVRGFGQQKDWKRDQGEVNRQAWETYAALDVAERNGLAATDDEVRALIRRDPSFQQNGAFSFALYRNLLRQNGLDELRFEEYLRRRTTLMRLAGSVLSGAIWASPMEIDRAVADMTDTLTVKVATFTQDPKDAAAVKLDDAGLKKWYDANTNSLALPERVKIRYVKFDATQKDVLAKMVVTEDEMHDRYDATVERYTSTDTNGVETVKKFEEVKAEIEKDLRQIAAVQYFETNLNAIVYSAKPAKGVSRLDEIAREQKLKVETSDWFSTDGAYQEGFMRRSYQILPGAENFLEAVAELDSTSEDLRYAVVLSKRAVWLVEKVETSPAHLPTFAEAKEAIRARALRDAKADAFKASVEKIIAKGEKAVLATKSVSTNMTFVVGELTGGMIPDQMQVARAAMKLKKGEISPFTPTSSGRGIVVVCQDRVEGDAAKAVIMRAQISESVTAIQQREIPESWQKWNLERLGFVTGEGSSVETAEAAE